MLFWQFINRQNLREQAQIFFRRGLSRSHFSHSWQQFRGDIFGGTIAALIAMPYGMAIAITIGLRPEVGLYTSIIGGIVYGLLANSPVLISGLSATVVPVLLVVAQQHGLGGVLAASFLCGVWMTLLGVLRLGRFVNYLPQPVIRGFTSGLGMIIIASQLKSLLGVNPPPPGFSLGIVGNLYAIAGSVPQARMENLLIGAIVILTMIVLPRWKANVPASLVGITLAAAATWFFDLNLPLVGTLPNALPRPDWTALDFSAFSSLLYPSLTLAGLCTINQLLTAVVADQVSNLQAPKQFNRELIAQGVANLVSPLFGAPPGVAMLARTVASAGAGAMSRLSVIAHSLVLLLFLFPLRGLISHIPLAALAAVTVAVGWQVVDWKRFFNWSLFKRRESRIDLVLFFITWTLVVLSDLVTGVVTGFLLSTLFFIERSAETTRLIAVSLEEFSAPAANERKADLPAEQCYRLVGPLFFASSGKLLNQLRREVCAPRLILNFEKAGPFDSAVCDFLRTLHQMQSRRGGELHLTGLTEQLYAVLEKDGLVEELGRSRVHFNSLSPVAA